MHLFFLFCLLIISSDYSLSDSFSCHQIINNNKIIDLSGLSRFEVKGMLNMEGKETHSCLGLTDDEVKNMEYNLTVTLCPEPRLILKFIEAPDCPTFDIGSKFSGTDIAGSHFMITLNGTSSPFFDKAKFKNEISPSETVISIECSSNLEPHLDLYFDSYLLYTRYSIVLQSKAGCILDRVTPVENTCLLETDHDVTFDFGSLMNSKGFDIESPDGTYSIGVCSNTPACPNSSVCWPKGRHLPFPVSSAQFLYHPLIGIQLMYQTKNADVSTVVNMKCWKKASTKTEFISNKNNVLQLNLYTSLACHPKEPPNCQDNYNLSELRSYSGNRNVIIEGKKIIFNVCHPLNYEKKYPFTGGSLFAVLIEKNGTAFSLGDEQLPSKTDPFRNVIISFKGNEGPYKLKIVLECAVEYKESISASLNNTMYIILWKTPVACSNVVIHGHNCNFRGKFDFTSLHSVHDTKIIDPRSQTSFFRMNLCSALSSSKEKAGVIWKVGEKEIIIGGILDSPVLWENTIKFNASGKRCGDRRDKSFVSLLMTCPRSKNEIKSEPHFIRQDGCHFSFNWETQLACWNKFSSNCVIKKGSSLYDLTPLSENEENYSVDIDETRSIYFQICKSIKRVRGLNCPESSGACLMDTFPELFSDRYTSIGDIETSKGQMLSINSQDQNVVLTYQSQISQFTHKFIINFKCHSKTEKPKFVESINNTIFIVEWRTEKACPLNHHRKPHVTTDSPTVEGPINHHNKPPASEPPAVIDEHNNHNKNFSIIVTPTVDDHTYSPLDCVTHSLPLVDLHSLNGHTWKVEGMNTMISICQPLTGFKCPPKSGICAKRGSSYVNIGTANGNLLKKPHLVYLNYSGPGAFQTFISFGCFLNKNPPKNIYSMDEKTTFVYWPTTHACNFQELNFDFCQNTRENPLCEITETAKIRVDKDTDIYVSLQGQLNHSGVSSCPSGTGVCLVQRGRNSLTPLYLSLGYPVNEAVENFGFHTVLFSNGDLCDRQGNQYYSTIRFNCDPSAGKGQPVFIGSEGCHFFLTWNTSSICPPSAVDPSMVSNSKMLCGLSPFECLRYVFPKPEEIIELNGKGSYLIDWSKIPGRPSYCGANICVKSKEDIWKPFADFRTSTYLHTNKSTLIEFDNSANHFYPSQDTCNAKVFLKCAPEGPDSHFMLWDVNCSIGIVWKSHRVCFLDPEQVINTLTKPEETISWGWILVIIVTSVISIFCCCYCVRCRKDPYRIIRQLRKFSRQPVISKHDSFDSETTLFMRPGTSSSYV